MATTLLTFKMWFLSLQWRHNEGDDVSEITGVSIAYLTIDSSAYQRKYQCYASLAFVRGIHRWPVDSPHKGPVTQKMFPFDDVIVYESCCTLIQILLSFDWRRTDEKSWSESTMLYLTDAYISQSALMSSDYLWLNNIWRANFNKIAGNHWHYYWELWCRSLFCYIVFVCVCQRLIIDLRPANERRRYKVTPSLIGCTLK